MPESTAAPHARRARGPSTAASLALLLASIGPAGARAQADPVPIPGLHAVEYFDLDSKAVGDRFRIFVYRPVVTAPDTRYPAIYVLDGNFSSGLVAEPARLMGTGGEIPPAFVVGVGYPTGANPMAATAKRYRDYTPNAGGPVEAVTLQAMPQGQAMPAGGGPAFLRFLREELKPLIQSRYPVEPGDATLGGMSLGGLFAAWVLLTDPGAFQRYVIVSPSIWWNDEEVWRWEERYAAGHADLKATVFVTAGGLETLEAGKATIAEYLKPGHPFEAMAKALSAAYATHGWPRMAEITPVLADRLRARKYPGLTILTHNLPDETHLSVGAGAWARGLRFVFGHWRP